PPTGAGDGEDVRRVARRRSGAPRTDLHVSCAPGYSSTCSPGPRYWARRPWNFLSLGTRVVRSPGRVVAPFSCSMKAMFTTQLLRGGVMREPYGGRGPHRVPEPAGDRGRGGGGAVRA